MFPSTWGDTRVISGTCRSSSSGLASRTWCQHARSMSGGSRADVVDCVSWLDPHTPHLPAPPVESTRSRMISGRILSDRPSSPFLDVCRGSSRLRFHRPQLREVHGRPPSWRMQPAPSPNWRGWMSSRLNSSPEFSPFRMIPSARSRWLWPGFRRDPRRDEADAILPNEQSGAPTVHPVASRPRPGELPSVREGLSRLGRRDITFHLHDDTLHYISPS